MLNQKQFIKRLERLEAAVSMLEKRRAFYSSPEQKVDFDRLTGVEMNFLGFHLRNTGFQESMLTRLEKDTMDELFEKAAGIRDDITVKIKIGTKARTGRYCKIHRPQDPPPWESSLVHGRYLSLLETAVRNHPDFQNEPQPEPPFSADLAFKQLRAIEAEIRARKKRLSADDL